MNLCWSGKTQSHFSHLIPLTWSQEKTRQCHHSEDGAETKTKAKARLKHFRADLLVWISRTWVNLWVCYALLVYSEPWSLVEPNCDRLCQVEAEFSAIIAFTKKVKLLREM